MTPGMHTATAPLRVDTAALDGAAAALLLHADACSGAMEDLLSHAPDPGAPAAAEVVDEVVIGAVDALQALAGALRRSSADLRAAADGYRAYEHGLAGTTSGT